MCLASNKERQPQDLKMLQEISRELPSTKLPNLPISGGHLDTEQVKKAISNSRIIRRGKNIQALSGGHLKIYTASEESSHY